MYIGNECVYNLFPFSTFMHFLKSLSAMKCPILPMLTNSPPFSQQFEIVPSFTFHCLENKKYVLKITLPQIRIFRGTKIKHITKFGGYSPLIHMKCPLSSL